MSTVPEHPTAPTPAVHQRLGELVALLTRSHGPRLKTVTAYGPWLHEPGDRRAAATVLVVIDGLDPARLRADAADLTQLRRLGLEPLFLEYQALLHSLDVFPLEFLDMQALYEVAAGEDLLADLNFPPAALRLQVEEELRSQRCGFHQELAREGHRPRSLRKILAQRFGELSRVWRGLLSLAGQTVPAAELPLIHATAAHYGLDSSLLEQLRGVQEGERQPDFEELGRLADAFDRLLVTLTDTVDQLDGEGS